MNNNILKRTLCVIMSATLIGQSGVSFGSESLTNGKVSEIAKKAAPYVLGIGIPVAVAASIIIPMAMSDKQEPNKETEDTSTEEDGEDFFVSKDMLDKCISKGKLPGIKLYYEKKGKSFTKYGYTLENEELARQFLEIFCGLNTKDIDNILRKDHLNVFFAYADNSKLNLICMYSHFWLYIKEALNKLDKITVGSANKVSVPPSVNLNTSYTVSSSASGSVKPGGAIPKVPNQEIIDKIQYVESLGDQGNKYFELYNNLRLYGGGYYVGNVGELRDHAKDAVKEGVIPGLALLTFDSKVDLWLTKINVSTWGAYKILDEDVFKGYLKLCFEDNNQPGYSDVFARFKGQDQKFFLYDNSQNTFVSYGNWIKRLNIKGVIGIAKYVKGWFGYVDRDDREQAKKFFMSDEFLRSEEFKKLNQDLVVARRSATSIIDFSNYEIQPLLPPEISGYENFLNVCNAGL